MPGYPIRGRFNAWFFRALDCYMHSQYADIKPRLLREAPSVMVELGPGSGTNLRYLRPGTRLIAFEPNLYMHPNLRRRAREYGIDLDLRGTSGEDIDLPSASVDFVFSSCVLCSVGRPEKVIAEVRRVLRHGGRFACIEHVAAPEGSPIQGVQRLLRKPWQWIFAGCDLCRDTGTRLLGAGFAEVDVQPLELPKMFVPIRPQIAAVCVK
jgi:SAM-dependent methyltransferase